MDQRTLQRRRSQRARERRRRRLIRFAALGGLGIVLAAAGTAVALALGGSGSSGGGARGAARAARRARRRHGSRHALTVATGATLGPPTGRPGNARVPILMYHVINPPFPDSPYPGLYVPRAEFAAQMQALHNAGWHAVTLDQVRQNWLRGDRLPARPFVITFDNGYRSQYTNALPVLRRLHWAADENLQLNDLPGQGGLTSAQVRGLIHAGWELDTQGISHADLVELDGSELHAQVAGARRTLRRRYGVPVDWFCYPSGQYDPTVVAAVRAAGFVGSTTVVPGWGARTESPYMLPRLRVLGGTSPAALLAQIDDARGDPIPPPSYTTSSS